MYKSPTRKEVKRRYLILNIALLIEIEKILHILNIEVTK